MADPLLPLHQGKPAHDALVRDALAARQACDAAGTIALLRQAIDSDPAVAHTHLLLAGELARAGHDAEAESAYAAALWLDPGLLAARFRLGLMQLGGLRTMAALLTWQPLFALPESHALRHAVYGIATLVSGEPDGAVLRLREALAHCEDDPQLAADLARLLAAIEHAPAAATERSTRH